MTNLIGARQQYSRQLSSVFTLANVFLAAVFIFFNTKSFAGPVKNDTAGLHEDKENLALSAQYPVVGEQINISYNPDRTVLAGKSDFDAVVYFLDGKNYPAYDINLKLTGKTFAGTFMIPVNAKAFVIKISSRKTIDNNNGRGYIYLIYNHNKPEAGAYAEEAGLFYNGPVSKIAGIYTDWIRAVALYKKEFEWYPQSRNVYQSDYDSLLLNYQARYEEYLARSDDQENKVMAMQDVSTLTKNGDERSMELAAGMLQHLDKEKQADSLENLIKLSFPAGESVKNSLFQDFFYREKNPVRREAIYNTYIKKYPLNNTDLSKLADFRSQLAAAYLEKGDFPDYRRLAEPLADKYGLAIYISHAASVMSDKGSLDTGARFGKMSLDLMKAQMGHPVQGPYESVRTLKDKYQASYDEFSAIYAFILYKQKKYKDALAYEQPVYEHAINADHEYADDDRIEINLHYALFLKAVGHNQQAQQVIENAVKNGDSSSEMIAMLKEIYIKLKGTGKGYEDYVASVNHSSAKALRADLGKQMTNKPAPPFSLKNLDGNTVSLADLKGKVVVIDFWGMWCHACKESFPGMQIVVNKYKDNPNVKFVFIDTYEQGDFLPKVKKYIADNKFTFNVLIDETGKDGQQSKVVSEYDAGALPTKLILDADGTIRFRETGFRSTDALVSEVQTMIDLTLHPQLAAKEYNDDN